MMVSITQIKAEASLQITWHKAKQLQHFIFNWHLGKLFIDNTQVHNQSNASFCLWLKVGSGS